MLKDIVKKNRSYRRFDESRPIERKTLIELIDLARLSPSAANLQPLKYAISNAPDVNDKVFPTLAWAGYLKDWDGPSEGERPSAYIIILGDTAISKNVGCDHGIAAQSILLGAVEIGLGGCMIGSVDRDALRLSLAIPAGLEILLVLAIGVPVEKVVIEDAGLDGAIKYYRDADQIHHVPKRPIKDIVIG